MSMSSELSPSDVALISGRNGQSDGAFGGNGAWWIVILFLFVFCGWGGWGRSFGGGGNSGAGVMDGYVLTSDFATVERKLDTIQAGICDSTYALNNTMVNGFANAELSRANGQQALMQQLYNMSLTNQQCCCETQRQMERGFADTNYNLATQACDTRNTIQNAARDITDNQNANARAILDALTQQRIEAKNERIHEQEQQITALQLAASQATQNAYLINQLRPCPVPAYTVPNPFCCNPNPCPC